MALDQELLAAALPRYEIGQEIGRGGWGIVLRGRHRDLGRDVAIKQLPRAFGADPSVRERFIDEARLVARLDHPHIVPVYDFVEHEGLCVIVMELAGGGTLWNRFSERGLETEETVATVLAAAVGLHHAHLHGVLHRDVKPENILFSTNGTAKIADFGIAKTLGEGAAARTATGALIGTAAYMAPEQVTGDELSPMTDVYSLAIVLYELLTGELPYRAVTEPVAQLFQHVNDDPRPMADVLPGVPPSLEAVTRRALAKDPSDRPESAEEFAVELAEAATAALGPGWLARSGYAVMSATSVVAATERPPPSADAPGDESGRRAGTVIVRAAQEHPRLGAVASAGPAPRSRSGPAGTSPPGSAPPPPPGSAPPPPPLSAPSSATPSGPAPSTGSRRVWALIAAAVVVAAAVAGILVVGSGGDNPTPTETTLSSSSTGGAAAEITVAEINEFTQRCNENGVPENRCQCAIDRAVDELTAEEFRANLALMANQGGAVTDPVAKIFQACIDDGF